MDATKEFFDGYADKWDEVNRYDRPEAAFANLVDMLNLKKGDTVADVGCGTGVLIPYLLDKVGGEGIIYAVDVSEKMLTQLQKKYPHKNIRLIPNKAENLSSINDKLDAVICFSAFPHVEDKKSALLEAAKVLKKGGRFLIAHFSSRHDINDFHSKLAHPICTHVLPSESEMRSMLDATGFEFVKLVDQNSTYELHAIRR